MTISKQKAPLLAALLLLVPVDRAFTQELQPIGTLTIAGVTEQPVQVFSAGVSYTIPPPTGGAPAPAVASFSTFTLTKLVDGTSPKLLVNAASGRLFPQARIDLFGPGGTTVLTSYELFNTLVLGAVVNSVLVGTNRALVEEVSLDYQKIKQTVITPAGPVEACWDRVQNTAC